MSFYDKVYDIVLQIPRGKVATYGQIALLAGSPRASRAVGEAMRRNPMPGILPCHRVLNRMGEMAPDFVFGGTHLQRQRLEEEGVCFLPDGRVDLARSQWNPLEEENPLTVK